MLNSEERRLPSSMANDIDDFGYLTGLFEREYASLHHLLAHRIGDSEVAADLLHNAIVSSQKHTSAPEPSSGEFAVYVVRIALNTLGSRYEAQSTKDLGVWDLNVVLEDIRKLLSTTDVPASVSEQVINSFPSSAHREIVRRAFRADVANASSFSDYGINEQAAARVVFRANRRLRIAMHQRQLRNSLLDAAVNSTLETKEPRAMRRQLQRSVVESDGAAFEVDAWLVKWLQQPIPAFNNRRPDELLRTRVQQQRLTHGFLRVFLRQERDRLHLQRLLLEGARSTTAVPTDAAYFDSLRRIARGE